MRFGPCWYEKFQVNVPCTCVGWGREREREREFVCVCVCRLRGGGIMRDEEKVGVIEGILVMNLSSDLTNVSSLSEKSSLSFCLYCRQNSRTTSKT